MNDINEVPKTNEITAKELADEFNKDNPSDRGKAYLRYYDIAQKRGQKETSSEIFNEAVKLHEGKKKEDGGRGGRILPENKTTRDRKIREQEEKENYIEAHLLNADQVKELIQKVTEKSNDTLTWICWKLFKDGNWHEELKIEDFTPLLEKFKTSLGTTEEQKETNDKIIKEAVEILRNTPPHLNLNTREEAFELLLNNQSNPKIAKIIEVSNHTFNKIISMYESEGSVLELSEETQAKRQIKIEVYQMTAEEAKAHLDKCLETGPDEKAWQIVRINKKGKWPEEDFGNHKAIQDFYNK